LSFKGRQLFQANKQIQKSGQICLLRQFALWLEVCLEMRFLLSLVLLSLGLTALAACSPSPSKFQNTLSGSQAPIIEQRRLIVTFEREINYTPVANCEVFVDLKGPSKLISPSSGRGRTNGAGQLEISIEPVGIYDQNALKNGDIVVEYPADITFSITLGETTYEWDLDHLESFARYQDPLYQGLNRDPDTAPISMTLTVP
jgi:hypothetical protein